MAAPRLLALEWDTREARVVLASVRGRQATIEQAFSVPLDSRGDSPEAVEPARRLAQALVDRRIGRMETLVAVGRASIELKLLTLPPTSDDDLPGLVRFQALREFNALGEDWSLDYVPLDDDPAAPRTVLAAAVSPDLVKQIRETCQAADLAPSHLVLRPCAAASLFTRREPAAEGVRLLVDLLADEADLTVLDHSRTVFLRTARLRDPLAGQEGTRPLASEIRRTLAAVHNQLGERRVESVYLCGAGPGQAELVRQLEEDLKLPVRPFDPWQGFPLGPELKRRLPDNPGRFAPLIGLVADEAAGAPHAIDFLSPRRAPERPTRRKQGVAIAAGVAVAAACLTVAAVARLMLLDARIERLAAESKSWDASVAEAALLEQSAEECTAWQGRQVMWLDELRLLSERFPESKDGMLTGLTLSAGEEGGQVQLDGLVRDVGVVSALESRLRDRQHSVSGNSRQEDETQPPYGWRFSSSMRIASPEESAEGPGVADAATPATDAR
jgi:Tfp pilus assembly PilM family ATPase